MNTRAALVELVARVDRHKRIAAIVAAAFEPVQSNRVCVRRDEVVRHVADVLSQGLDHVMVTARLRREVRTVVRLMGGVPTARGNKRIFRKFKRLNESIGEAADRSRDILSR